MAALNPSKDNGMTTLRIGSGGIRVGWNPSPINRVAREVTWCRIVWGHARSSGPGGPHNWT
jgi:hypothetical protein